MDRQTDRQTRCFDREEDDIIIIIIIIIMGDLYSIFHSTRRFTKISIHSWRNIFKETSFKHSK